MAGWELAFSAVLALLLVAMIAASLRLDRALRSMRRDRGAFEALVSNLASANQSVALGIQALREEAEGAARQVTKCVSEADKMATDLSFLVEAADNAGSRLEARLREARSARGASAAIDVASPESRIVRAARMLHVGRAVPGRAGAPASVVPVPVRPFASGPAASAVGPTPGAPASLASSDPPSGPMLRAGITLRRRTHAARSADALSPDTRAPI
jgi:hypothetical protein